MLAIQVYLFSRIEIFRCYYRKQRLDRDLKTERFKEDKMFFGKYIYIYIIWSP